VIERKVDSQLASGDLICHLKKNVCHPNDLNVAVYVCKRLYYAIYKVSTSAVSNYTTSHICQTVLNTFLH